MMVKKEKFIMTLVALAMISSPMHSQEKPSSFNNAILFSIDAEITALSFSLFGFTGFGWEASYMRRITAQYALMGDVKYIRLNAAGSLFSAYDISIHNRFPIAASRFFVDMKIGALIYESPYYKGWSFSPGIETGYRFIIRSHGVLEPYLGCSVYTDDKFIMPFTITALSEYIIPGFTIGVRYGIAF